MVFYEMIFLMIILNALNKTQNTKPKPSMLSLLFWTMASMNFKIFNSLPTWLTWTSLFNSFEQLWSSTWSSPEHWPQHPFFDMQTQNDRNQHVCWKNMRHCILSVHHIVNIFMSHLHFLCIDDYLECTLNMIIVTENRVPRHWIDDDLRK